MASLQVGLRLPLLQLISKRQSAVPQEKMAAWRVACLGGCPIEVPAPPSPPPLESPGTSLPRAGQPWQAHCLCHGPVCGSPVSGMDRCGVREPTSSEHGEQECWRLLPLRKGGGGGWRCPCHAPRLKQPWRARERWLPSVTSAWEMSWESPASLVAATTPALALSHPAGIQHVGACSVPGLNISWEAPRCHLEFCHGRREGRWGLAGSRGMMPTRVSGK